MTSSPTPPFDPAPAHRFFSAECFNRAWDLIDKVDRSAEEDDEMRALCHASLWHWTQREDGTASHLSIGYWQLSRVYALLGRATDAAHYGERCLECSREESAFFLGYAYEALARAAKLAGDAETLASHLAEARRLCAQVTAPEDRAMLERDLEELG